VILYGTGACTGFCEIYRIIGLLRGIKPKSVMREISYALSQANGIEINLSLLAGLRVNKTDVHNALVIAYLGKIFKSPELSLYSKSI
ncbi:MAG: hypothetical protein K2L54_03225, partial [Clostridiales bacterium]|nr:hypothetical protein [Clostridiales bacterium]